jgi:hypothetical protein
VVAATAGSDAFTILTVRLVVAAALSLCLAGCGVSVAASETPTAPSGPTTSASPAAVPETEAAAETQPRTVPVAAMGRAVAFTDGSTAGTIMLKRIDRIPAAQAGNSYARPTHGSFLIAHFRMGVTRGSAVASALTFQVQTQDGKVYPAVSGVVQEPLNGRKTLLPAGEHVRGDAAFDVPEGRLLISYAPSGSPVVSFTVVG